jgi:hypothetical protein
MLVLLHDLELKPTQKFQHGSAVDAEGAKLEIKCALEGGTCQLGKFYCGNTTFKRIKACDFVLFTFFSRVDPLRIVSAYKVPVEKVLAIAIATNYAIPNCSISERWAATNGTNVFLELIPTRNKARCLAPNLKSSR